MSPSCTVFVPDTVAMYDEFESILQFFALQLNRDSDSGHQATPNVRRSPENNMKGIFYPILNLLATPVNKCSALGVWFCKWWRWFQCYHVKYDSHLRGVNDWGDLPNFIRCILYGARFPCCIFLTFHLSRMQNMVVVFGSIGSNLGSELTA